MSIYHAGRFFVAAAVFFAILTGYLVYQDARANADEQLTPTVERPEMDVADVVIGAKQEVQCIVNNPHDYQISVVGVQEGCQKNCCFYGTTPESVSIPAHGSGAYTFSVRVPYLHPFQGTVEVFVNDKGRLVKLPIAIHGTGIAATPKSN